MVSPEHLPDLDRGAAPVDVDASRARPWTGGWQLRKPEDVGGKREGEGATGSPSKLVFKKNHNFFSKVSISNPSVSPLI